MLSIADWSGELVIYNHQSGDTHLFLSDILPFIQYCLMNSDFSSSDLMNHCDINVAPLEKEKLVESFLSQFTYLNILQPLNCEGQ